MADRVDTGGGPSIGRDVESGEFVGRDRNTIYNIENMDTDETVKLIARRMLGSPLYGVKGVLDELKEINERLEVARTDNVKATAERVVLRQRLDRQMAVMMVLMVIISIEALAIIYLLSQAWI